MTDVTAVTDVVVTGVGLVCPVAESTDALLAAAPDGEDAAGTRPDWFDPVPLLGRRGWKYLTPATRYLLAAASSALADAGLEPRLLPDESVGVVVGTNFAASPVVDRLDRTVITQGAKLLSPAETPNFLVNIPASTVSIRFGMRAFNLSLTNPMVAGVESVLTLAAAIRAGRARAGLAGATEERPERLAASEGACCFTVETAAGATERGGVLRARVVGGCCRFVPPGGELHPLRRTLAELIEPAGGELPYAMVSVGEVGRRVGEVVGQVAEGAGVTLLRRDFPGADGRYVTVSPMLAMAGLLATYGQGLVVATSPHGHVAALRLERVREPSSDQRATSGAG